jgi:hypothetical protein
MRDLEAIQASGPEARRLYWSHVRRIKRDARKRGYPWATSKLTPEIVAKIRENTLLRIASGELQGLWAYRESPPGDSQ